MLTRRQDEETSDKISETLRMQTAFGRAAALDLLHKRALPEDLARAALAGRYERRVQPGYSSSSPRSGS